MCSADPCGPYLQLLKLGYPGWHFLGLVLLAVAVPNDLQRAVQTEDIRWLLLYAGSQLWVILLYYSVLKSKPGKLEMKRELVTSNLGRPSIESEGNSGREEILLCDGVTITEE